MAKPSCSLSGEIQNWSYHMYPLGSSSSTERMEDRVVIIVDANSMQTEVEYAGVSGFSKSGRLYASSLDWDTTHLVLPLPLDFASSTPLSLNSRWRSAVSSSPYQLNFRLSDCRQTSANGLREHSLELSDDITSIIGSSSTVTISGKSQDGVLRFSETFQVGSARIVIDEIKRIGQGYAKDLDQEKSCVNDSGELRILKE